MEADLYLGNREYVFESDTWYTQHNGLYIRLCDCVRFP